MVFRRSESELLGRKIQMHQPSQFWPKMAILTVLTQSQQKSDQFEVFKGYIDALNPNLIVAKLKCVHLTSFGYL